MKSWLVVSLCKIEIANDSRKWNLKAVLWLVKKHMHFHWWPQPHGTVGYLYTSCSKRVFEAREVATMQNYFQLLGWYCYPSGLWYASLMFVSSTRTCFVLCSLTFQCMASQMRYLQSYIPSAYLYMCTSDAAVERLSGIQHKNVPRRIPLRRYKSYACLHKWEQQSTT